jgi:DNA-binding GntR family transcriptional regulator
MNTKTQDLIAQTLEDEIISGKLLPGFVLHQEELADRFGVSRQPIRAALDALTAKGLAERCANRSIEVSALHTQTVEEIIEIRNLLEVKALTASTMKLTGQDLLAARQALERFELEEIPENLFNIDMQFHMALYSRCNNQTLLKMITDLRRTSRRAYLGQTLGSHTRNRCIDEHQKLYEAVAEQDVAKARSLLLAHFNIPKESRL